MLVKDKKVVYYHRIESDLFRNLEMVTKTKKWKSKLEFNCQVIPSCPFISAIFKKVKLSFQEVCLSQVENGIGQINESCQFVQNYKLLEVWHLFSVNSKDNSTMWNQVVLVSV